MYSFKSRVRFSETDLKGVITFGNIVNYMQDCSTFHSEGLGVGIEALKKYNKTWMISSWYIEILRYPIFGEEIEIITSPYSFNKVFGNRNFIIKDSKGKILVKADSKWVLVDSIKQKILKIGSEDTKLYKISEKIEMNQISKKISEPLYGENLDKILIDKSYIDSNNHMNNEKYIEVSIRYLPKEFKKFRSMRIEYKKSAVLGDTIFIKVGKSSTGYVVCLSDNNGTKYALAEFIN